MELFTILKKFQHIEHNKAAAERSRAAILSTPRIQDASWQTAFRFLTARPVFAVAAFALLVLVGGFSISKLSPKATISSLDPTSLKAEADAIDIQIQLTNLNYRETDQEKLNESTTPIAPQQVKKEVQQQAESLGLTATSTNTNDAPQIIDVDGALERLAE